jgi:hypothetical protein
MTSLTVLLLSLAVRPHKIATAPVRGPCPIAFSPKRGQNAPNPIADEQMLIDDREIDPADERSGRAAWGMDPTRLALDLSIDRGEALPKPFCSEVGRRLLLAELQFSRWILRRVEKIDLSQDRSVSRRIALELSVRDDAPEFEVEGSERRCLVPLSLMRRRTLVNLELRDEAGHPLFLPGLRLTQQLDQSVMLAAAATVSPSLAEDDEVAQFVQMAVAGELAQVRWAYRAFDRAERGPLLELRQDSLFRYAANRFRYNFSLYTFLPAPENKHSLHQLVTLGFSEPLAWKYRVPTIKAESGFPDCSLYSPGEYTRLTPSRVLAAIGLKPIRVRFQVPGAENAASYHVEIASPPGLQIIEATLLAGRPNDPNHSVSEDRVVGHTPVVGLHAVEVPSGSLCRVQVRLGVPAGGWLAAVWASSLAVSGVLASVAYHWHQANVLNSNQTTNVVLILVTAAAAAATLVAQRDNGGVAARFVSGLRALGTVSTVLPLIAAALLTYADLGSNAQVPLKETVRAELWTLTGVGLLIAVIFTTVILKSFAAQYHEVIRESPWDQSEPASADEGELEKDPPQPSRPEFHERLGRYGFGRPAVSVRSAEGWHDRYEWTGPQQDAAVRRLERIRFSTTSHQPCTSPSDRCSRGEVCGLRSSALGEHVAGGDDADGPAVGAET